MPALGADLSRTSVSGLSSGAFMTVQLHMAFNDIMVGAGVIAGGPYLCARSWPLFSMLQNAVTTCMNPLPGAQPNTPRLVKLTQDMARAGDIPPLGNLADDRLYIFSGSEDATVTTLVVDQTVEYYRQIGVPVEQIRYDKSVPAGHAIITDNDGDVACSTTAAPFINDCDFEQSARILQHIYGELQPAAAKAARAVQAFDQREFITDRYTSMDDTAYVYVPQQCEQGGCPVHIVMHGCQQGASVIGDRYYARTGYNELADSNGFIMLYPQVHPSDMSPYNPKGCWDFWGYSTPASLDNYTGKAPQLRTIRRMLDRLAQPVAAQ